MLNTLIPEPGIGDNQPEMDSRLTYCFVHGSWHGAWCWELLRPELEAAGHNTIAMDLPIDSPTATYETYADIVAEHIDDPANTIVVGHSRAGNVLPRTASRKAVRQLIYLCAGFDPNNERRLRHHFLAPVPQKYNPDFERGLIYHDDGQLVSYDSDVARELFYHDCSDEVARAAAAHLRPMHRAKLQPPVKKWPKVPAAFIYTEQDQVIRPEYSEYISRSLGLRAIEMTGGHSIFLSQPELLARVLDRVAVRV